MGRKGATDAEVIDAAKKCGCHEFIMGLENGYRPYAAHPADTSPAANGSASPLPGPC